MENTVVSHEGSIGYWQEKYLKIESERAIWESQKAELIAKIRWYENQFKLAQHLRYGQSSEKAEVQLVLFNEAEWYADTKTPLPEVQQIPSHTRKKPAGKRKEDFSNLSVEVVTHTLPAEEQNCSRCGNPLHIMSRETRRELEIIPPQVKIIEHVQDVFSCRYCEKNDVTVPIIKAKAPAPVIKGSISSASAVAHIMVQKYLTAVPLYRQEQEFNRQNIPISRQTMANWLIKCSEDWLTPVYDHLHKELIKRPALHSDETTMQVLKEPNRKASNNSYMWLYRSGGYDDPHPIVLYEYQETRSSANPRRFLAGFNGYLHTDGYSGYHVLPPEVTIVGCWAHARRGFNDALKVLDKEDQKDSVAMVGLSYCNHLFHMEKSWLDLSPEDRRKQRLEKSKPVAEKLINWAKSLCTLPKSPLGKAVGYLLNQWPYLQNVYLDGRLELSNNKAERSIKPFVIGRKNWLFCNTRKGAAASSVIYSIIETAKENQLNVFEYLKFLMQTLPNCDKPSEIMESILPWSEDLPSICRIKQPVKSEPQ